MENPQKVVTKLQQLNVLTPGQTWIAINDYNVMPLAQSTVGGLQFNSGVGFVVKIFMNTTTGEIKCFPFNLFEG